jgi:hypothetical protein
VVAFLVGPAVESAYDEALMLIGSGRNVVLITADEPEASVWKALVRTRAPGVAIYVNRGSSMAVMGKAAPV